MARALYTVPFIQGVVTNAAPLSAELDTDTYVWVVRDISGMLENPSPGFGARLLISSSAFVMFALFVPPGAFETFHWEGRVALAGPADITAQLDSELADCHLFVSGYQLTKP